VKFPRFGLRTKLALMALLLLALPWAGYQYVREMERFLLEGEEQALLATARAVATALHDRPKLLQARPERDSDPRRMAEDELRRIDGAGPAPQSQDGADSQDVGPRTNAIIARESSPRDEPQEITEILRGVQRTTSRVWIVTRDLRVLALAGTLKRDEGEVEDDDSLPHRLLGWLFPRPSENFDDAIEDDALATGREITAALRGIPGARLRRTPDGKAMVISAAHPIWNGDDVVGAVVAEETTNPILSVRTRALEQLLFVTLVVFVVAAAAMIWFATRISTRIRRLRDEAESAVDVHGRLARPNSRVLTAQNSSDEIGDVSRSFAALLARLQQYNTYLESMASRMSHELRTPIAVVRSSLENLKLAHTAEESRVYIARAEDGLKRLGTILTRMSEATRLEQSLSALERERFDLEPVVKGSVEGYRIAYPNRAFELELPGKPLLVDGSPDLAAQLLDKLVANAVDFAEAGTPIQVRLRAAGGYAELVVENRGPVLPETMRGKLFESMVSVRGARGDAPDAEPHLGLGLYIARVIAELHRGSVRAANLPGGDGVLVAATFQLV
jgi:dedicated sortase system histidine kinase